MLVFEPFNTEQKTGIMALSYKESNYRKADGNATLNTSLVTGKQNKCTGKKNGV